MVDAPMKTYVGSKQEAETEAPAQADKAAPWVLI